MTELVVDTGPLVALVDRRDRYHGWARQLFDTVQPPLHTCEPVLAEAWFLLRKIGAGDAVLGLGMKGILALDFRLAAELPPVRALMTKFAGIPMSLADACLVRMTELRPRSTIVTLDPGFLLYRRNRNQAVPTIMPD
jgi:predicted nucleic acid-binding protein